MPRPAVFWQCGDPRRQPHDLTPLTTTERGYCGAGASGRLPAIVKTPAGSVTADEVVLASGARLGLVPELRRAIFIIPSHVVAAASSRDALDVSGGGPSILRRAYRGALRDHRGAAA